MCYNMQYAFGFFSNLVIETATLFESISILLLPSKICKVIYLRLYQHWNDPTFIYWSKFSSIMCVCGPTIPLCIYQKNPCFQYSFSCENKPYYQCVQSILRQCLFSVSVLPLYVHITSERDPLSADRVYDLHCTTFGSRPSALTTWWLGKSQLLDHSNEVSTTTVCPSLKKELPNISSQVIF